MSVNDQRNAKLAETFNVFQRRPKVIARLSQFNLQSRYAHVLLLLPPTALASCDTLSKRIASLLTRSELFLLF